MGLLSAIPNVYDPKKVITGATAGASAAVTPTAPIPTPAKGPTGALVGASTGLPNGTVPIPQLAGGSGGGGWMGAVGAQNMVNVTTPGAMAGAQAGIPSTGIPTTPNKSIGEPPAPLVTPITTPTVNTQATVPSGLYQDPFARSREDIAKLAADRIAKILQAGKTSADGALTGAKNAYDYTNQIQGDTRTLRNASLKESANPFGGSFGYQAAMNNRNDSIADTAQDADYNAQVGLINQKLADLQAAAPGDEQAIIDQLEQIERQTGISVAQLQEQQKQNQFNNGMANKQFGLDEAQVMGYYKNAPTLASQQFQSDNAYRDKTYNQNQQVIDYNQDPNNPINKGQVLQNQGAVLSNKAQEQQNLLNQYKIDDYPAEQKANATKVQQELATGKLNLEMAEYNFKELKDPNSAVNQANNIDLELKKIDLKNRPEKDRLEIKQLQRQIEEIGKVHYKPQTQAEIDMDKVQLATAQEQLKQLQNKPNKTVEIDPKVSTDNYSLIIQDLNDAKDINEANALIEANRANLTDADYKAAKKAAIDAF